MPSRVCFIACYKPMAKGDSHNTFDFECVCIDVSVRLEEDCVDSVALFQLCSHHIRREDPLPFDTDRVPRGDLQLSDPAYHQPSTFNRNPQHRTDSPGPLWRDYFHAPLEFLQGGLLPAFEQDLTLPSKAPSISIVPPCHASGCSGDRSFSPFSESVGIHVGNRAGTRVGIDLPRGLGGWELVECGIEVISALDEQRTVLSINL